MCQPTVPRPFEHEEVPGVTRIRDNAPIDQAKAWVQNDRYIPFERVFHLHTTQDGAHSYHST